MRRYTSGSSARSARSSSSHLSCHTPRRLASGAKRSTTSCAARRSAAPSPPIAWRNAAVRSASLMSTTRMSSTIDKSILRRFSACASRSAPVPCAGVARMSSIRATPPTSAATSSPKRAASVAVSVRRACASGSTSAACSVAGSSLSGARTAAIATPRAGIGAPSARTASPAASRTNASVSPSAFMSLSAYVPCRGSRQLPGAAGGVGADAACTSATMRKLYVAGPEVVVGRRNARREADGRTPTERADTRAVDDLARHAFGLARVKGDVAIESDDSRHQRRELADRQLLAAAHIDQRTVVGGHQRRVKRLGQRRQQHQRTREVVGVQEFTPRLPASPDAQAPTTAAACLVRLAQERRENVSGRKIVVVAGPVEVGGHGREPAAPELAVVRPAHLDPRDLGDRVWPVGRLERTAQQRALRQRLRSVARIDARAAQEHDALDVRLVRRAQQADLQREVVDQEVDRRRAVRTDPTHLRCRDEHDAGTLSQQQLARRLELREVELAMRAHDDVVEATALELATNRAARQPAMPRDEDRRRLVH